MPVAALGARADVDLDEARAYGADPDAPGAIVREAADIDVVKRGAAVMPERPALRIPMTGPAVAHPDPQHAAAVLIERIEHDRTAAQALRVVRIVAVAHEALARAVEEVESVGRSDPEPLRGILENRTHTVVAERTRIPRIVAEGGYASRAWLQAIEAAAHGADPQRSRVVLEDGAHLQVGKASAIPRLAVVDEAAARRVVAAESAVGADPDAPGAVAIQRKHHIGGERVRVVVVVAKMARGTSGRIEQVEAAIERPRPDAARGVDQERAHRVAGE